MTPVVANLEVGKRYRVTTMMDHEKLQRDFIGTYLGQDYKDDLLFSLRPAFGTSAVRWANVVAAERTEKSHRGLEVVR